MDGGRGLDADVLAAVLRGQDVDEVRLRPGDMDAVAGIKVGLHAVHHDGEGLAQGLDGDGIEHFG